MPPERACSQRGGGCARAARPAARSRLSGSAGRQTVFASLGRSVRCLRWHQRRRRRTRTSSSLRVALDTWHNFFTAVAPANACYSFPPPARDQTSHEKPKETSGFCFTRTRAKRTRAGRPSRGGDETQNTFCPSCWRLGVSSDIQMRSSCMFRQPSQVILITVCKGISTLGASFRAPPTRYE